MTLLGYIMAFYLGLSVAGFFAAEREARRRYEEEKK